MSNSATPRRTFLSGAVAAATAAALPTAVRARTSRPPQDDWIAEVRGEHRCLFDFNAHKNGLPLMHILNYLNTYATAYGTQPGQVGAAATLYGIGGGSSIALGFDDATWAKYELGAYLGLRDANGRPYTRNVFHRPTAADAHLLSEAMDIPPLPPLEGAIQGLGIANLQEMGTKFIMCNNALGAWTVELAARGKGSAEAIGADLSEHLLPGVSVVPAMVIAIEQAQEAGIRYNKQ